MKTRIKAIVLCCCTGLLFACYEDKGNYNLVDYNQLLDVRTVNTLTKTTGVYGDTLRVYLKITWKYPERDTTTTAFEYRWEVSDELVSTERNLVYVPTRIGSSPCVLFITEKATGVVTRWSVDFNITSPYNLGWVILSEKEGRPALNFIRRDSRRDENNVLVYYWVDIKDVYASMYPDDPLPGNISQAISYTVDYYADEIILISDSGEDWILDGGSLQKAFLLKNDFLGGNYPNGFIPRSFARGGGADFVLGTNGQIYWRKNAQSSQMFHTDPIMLVPIYFPGDANIGHFIPMNTNDANFVMMFDELHNRIVACYASFNSGNNMHGGKMEIINPFSPTEFVDIRGFGDYKLIYCGHASGTSFNTILKDPVSGKYLIQEFTVSSSTTSMQIVSAAQREFEASDLITDNTVFWRMRSSAYLYFGEGSKLYFYDANTKSAKLYTDFGSARITHLMQDVDGTRIGVALDNGDFYLFNATSATVLGSDNPGEAGFLHKVSGLGTIKNLTWKHGGYYNLVFNRYS